jgi:hypothetical protein
MRNSLFVIFNNRRLPDKVSDINQCELVVEVEGGDFTVRLIAKKPQKSAS